LQSAGECLHLQPLRAGSFFASTAAVMMTAQVAAAAPQMPAAETNSADHPQSGASYTPIIAAATRPARS